MRRGITVIIVYHLNSRVIVWRAARCVRLCDRLSNPLSVMLGQLIIRANKTSHSCRYRLLVEVESDGMENCKMSEAL